LHVFFFFFRKNFFSNKECLSCLLTMASKSALEIVVEIKVMASVPANRAQMESSTTPILVMFLDHPSSDVVFNGTNKRGRRKNFF